MDLDLVRMSFTAPPRCCHDLTILRHLIYYPAPNFALTCGRVNIGLVSEQVPLDVTWLNRRRAPSILVGSERPPWLCHSVC